MRILIISQWFDPEPVIKGLAFARALAARGHEVEVLTGFPNYPGGRIYPGYQLRPRQVERVDGIRIVRVALYPSHDRSSVRRTLNFVSFGVAASVFGLGAVRRPDVAYVYNPVTTALPAIAAKAALGVPFVYDVQDLWPDTIRATGMLQGRLGLGMLGRWCQFTYRTADRIVVLSPGFRDTLVERGVPAEKISVIYNWCDEADIHPVAADPDLARHLGLAGWVNVMFAGNMGLAQALDAVLECALRCRGTLPEVQFVLIGGGVDRGRLEERARSMGLDNVRFLLARPQKEIAPILALADALLVHLKDDPLFRITIPSKTQAYLAAGRPVLMAVEGDAARLVREAGAGVCCRSEDPAALADAVRRLVQLGPHGRAMLGAAGRRFYEENLSLSCGVTRFERVFAAAAARSTRARVPP
jgi:glycosyltransferase involved in cell wall biosynthesis